MRNSLGAKLKMYNFLENIWDPTIIDTKISISIKKDFISFFIKFILDKKYKIWSKRLLYNKTNSFIYGVKITKLGEFSNLNIFYVNNL